MLNFHEIVPLAVRAAGERAVLAAPFPLSETLCRGFVSDGLISGFIANRRPEPGSIDPSIAGWWIERSQGQWFLRGSFAEYMILLGADAKSAVDAGMLLEARLKGIRSVLLVARDGSILNRIDVESTLVERLRSTAVDHPIHRASYDDMFNDVYALVGNRLRLPSQAFDPSRILLMNGSLDPSGSERQCVFTAIALERRYPGCVYLGRTYAGPTRDFFKATAEAAGVRLCAMPEAGAEYDSPHILAVRNKLQERYDALGVLDIFYMIFHHALLLREVRPGLVHTWQDWSNVFSGVAADLVGVPRLVLGGRSVATDNFTIFQPYMVPAYQALFRRRDVVFLNNSEAGARDYERWLGLTGHSIQVVHNGFDFPEIPRDAGDAIRTELGFTKDAIVIGSIFRFNEEKRPRLLLEMALILHRSHPDVRFVVFGDGPLLKDCRAFVVENGLDDTVKLPGLTTNAWAALASMNIFVLTSRKEGLPNVMIEAQAMGLPVVCTGEGGMYETFIDGETGIAVRIAEAGELAGAVISLINDQHGRAKMAKRAYRHARERFGMERMIDETLDAYRAAPEHKYDLPWTPSCVDPSSPSDVLLQGVRWEEGACFVASLPVAIDCSSLVLWENDHILGPKAEVQDVRDTGAGRYSIENGEIRFSSSDGSDARFNGRTYRLLTRNVEEIEKIELAKITIDPETGYCYIANIGSVSAAGRYSLWENELRLGPGDCQHADIRLQGQGRYSIWGESLYFSSSDNTDPRSNQRNYFLRKSTPMVASGVSTEVISGLSLEQSLQHLVNNSIGRSDFVPGRVVHVGGSLGPGGAERQIFHTLVGLQRRGVESAQLLCYYLSATLTEHHDFYLPEFQTVGVPVRTIRRRVDSQEFGGMPAPLRQVAQSLPADLAQDIADLYWEFMELRPQVVHSWLDGNNERAGFAAALAGVPRIIVSGRNVNPSHFPYIHQPYMRSAYQALLRLPQVRMVNNSSAGRNDYADWLGVESSRISVLYNGVEFKDRAHATAADIKRFRSAYSLREDALVIGGVFRFSVEKRPLLWIETAAAIAQRIPHAQFILFGKGELRVEMEQAVKRAGLGDRLIFGGVTQDILSALSAMDIFLLTSEFEGIPNVVLEAQWAGTPVVATPGGGTSEAVDDGETGWIVASATAKMLADRVVWLSEHPEERAKARTKGPTLVKDKFGVERMIDETLECYGISKVDIGLFRHR